MKNKLLILAGYFGLAPFIIIIAILFSLFLIHENNPYYNRPNDAFNNNIAFKSVPEKKPQTEITIYQSDARVEALKNFFLTYKSPLSAYAYKIVNEADKNTLDYRLLPAIAMQESNLCKKIPISSYNCWGFGIYGNKVTRFQGYDQAIEVVSKTLAQEYKQKGLVEPDDIMKKYTPSSNGSWSNGVTFFMDRITLDL